MNEDEGVASGGGDVGEGSDPGELEALLLAGEGSWNPSCLTMPMGPALPVVVAYAMFRSLQPLPDGQEENRMCK